MKSLVPDLISFKVSKYTSSGLSPLNPTTAMSPKTQN